MDGNKEAASELLDLGKSAFRRGDLESAMRRISKSQRLFPTSETKALLNEVEVAMLASKNGRNTESGDGSFPRSQSFSADASEGVRLRRASGASSAGGEESTATPEQIALVKRVLKASISFYEVLEVSKTCSDEDIKKAYRKLSLKVHPDKNKAPGAEDAFKMVSRAFKCLSDPHLRSNYDTYGHEEPNHSRLQQQRQPRHHAGHPFYQEDLDPNDIFNAFFGVPGMNGRVYVSRGFPSQRRARTQPREEEEDGMTPIAGLLRALPIVLFLLFFLVPSPDPPYKFSSSRQYSKEVRTTRWQVPFFVKSFAEFERSYPSGSAGRFSLEQTIEGNYKEAVEANCYQERLQRAQVQRWSGAERAKKMSMPYCDELQRLVVAH